MVPSPEPETRLEPDTFEPDTFEPDTFEPDTFEPDTKDWTWTLQRRCPQCGLEIGRLSLDEVIDRAEAAAVEWVQILTSSPAVGQRPRPTVWSALEYGAHVRDVYQITDARLSLMLVEDNPHFDNWDQDETAVAEDYAGEDPDAAAAELMSAATALIGRLRGLESSQLDRTGRRSDGAQFTVLSLSRYFLHDVLHHLWDVTGQQADEVADGG